MMLVGPFLLFLVGLRSVSCNAKFLNLDLDKADKERFKIERVEFDNVLYKQFMPLDGQFVVKVYQSDQKIWEAIGYEWSSYSLVAHRDGAAVLVYLRVDTGYKINHLYFKKVESAWSPIDINEYCSEISNIKRAETVVSHFGLSLSCAYDNRLYSVKYSNKDRHYTLFTPNLGHLATFVNFKNTNLWTAKRYADRCTAAWAYIHAGVYYMIRLLVTNSMDESRIYTYLLVKNNWVHIHTLENNHDKSIYVQRPDDFFYPDYTFNLKPMNEVTSEKKEETLHSHSKSESDDPQEVFSESYFDLSGDYFKYLVHDHDDYDDDTYCACSATETEVVEDADSVTEAYFDLSGDFYNYMVHDDDFDLKEESHDFSSRKTLDLKSPLALFFSNSRYVDNVYYKTYEPPREAVVKSVFEASTVVWNAQSDDEKCVYALAPQDKNNHAALYLLLEVSGKKRQAFYQKVAGVWTRSNFEDYKKKVQSLKNTEAEQEMTIDLDLKGLNSHYSVEPNPPKKSYLYFPKLGQKCTKVIHKNLVVWKPRSPEEKCVAVWSYEDSNNPFYARVLVSYGNGLNDLLSFLNVRSEWEYLTSYQDSLLSNTPFKKPTGLYNPEYDFNENVMDYEFEGASGYPPSRDAIKTDAVTEDKLNDLFKDRFTRLDYKPVYRPIPADACMPLDIGHLERGGGYDLEESVFDGKLHVVSCHAPPGRYFDAVYDKKFPVFLGGNLTHVVCGLNFYTKRGQLHLADLLVKVKNEDLTLYMTRVESLWVYISRERFFELLEELKNE